MTKPPNFHLKVLKIPWLKFSFTVCPENMRVLFGSSDVPGLGHQNTDLLIGYSAVSIYRACSLINR